MNRWAKTKQPGFTIVELLIVIVVIGILAAITVVAFNGIQNRTIETSAVSTLSQVGKSLEVAKTTDGSYPTSLPASVQSSGKFTVSLVPSTLPYYENIGAVQTGVLVSQICQDLINEGRGRNTNLGGGTENYITGCGNWNHDSMQVTGWSSRVFAIPISSSTFSNHANSLSYSDPWNPNRRTTEQAFYTEMESRVTAQGGSFPVTSFWDSWATSGNGGVVKIDLPTASSSPAGLHYCLQAVYDGDTAKTWRKRSSGAVSRGAC